MGVNEQRLLENITRDLAAVDQVVNGSLVLVPFYASVTTVKNKAIGAAGVCQPFQLDALGTDIKDIKLRFYTPANILTTYTVSILKTRPGDLVTFTQDLIKTFTIALPAANGEYSYDLGDLAAGLQAEIQIGQDNNGNDTQPVDAELTCLMSL